MCEWQPMQHPRVFFKSGHFHSLQLLDIPQVLFCQVVRLKTAARGNFSHP